jgi:hypothetical protein
MQLCILFMVQLIDSYARHVKLMRKDQWQLRFKKKLLQCHRITLDLTILVMALKEKEVFHLSKTSLV